MQSESTPNWYDDPRLTLGTTNFSDVASPVAEEVRKEYSLLKGTGLDPTALPKEFTPVAVAMWLLVITAAALVAVVALAFVMTAAITTAALNQNNKPKKVTHVVRCGH